MSEVYTPGCGALGMQRFRNSNFRSVVAVVLICTLAGCMTTASYSNTGLDKAIENLRPGDRIVVYTVAGQVYDIEVAEVSADSVLSSNRSIDKQDIARIEMKKRSVAKTMAAVVGGTLVGLLAAIGAFVLWDLSTPDD